LQTANPKGSISITVGETYGNEIGNKIRTLKGFNMKLNLRKKITDNISKFPRGDLIKIGGNLL
jgi:hypothetical protein